MATRLKNILRFTGLVVGTPVSLAHNLNLDGVGVIPDESIPQSGGFTVIADATNVTVTRNVGDADNVDVLAKYWHTENRVFGSDGTPFTQLAPAPFTPVPGSGQASPVLLDGSVVNVYVDSINGLDANDGLTTTTAIRTVTELYTKFPIRALQNSRIIVHFAGVGGFGASATGVADYDTVNLLVGGDGAPWGSSYVYRAPQMVPVTPATGPATAALDVVPVVAIAGGSANAGGTRAVRFDFTTAAPAWTVNDFTNKYLRITRAGALVIYEVPIASNTADTITVLKDGLAALPTAILATDTVEIVEPGARFINTTDPGTGFDQVRITGTGTSDWDNQDLAPAPGVGLTFTRFEFRSPPVISGAFNIEFDRCVMLGNKFVYNSSLAYVACILGKVYHHGCHMSGSGFAPTPDSATSPIVANRNAYLDFQCEYMEIGSFEGTSAPSSWGCWRGVSILGAAGFYMLWVDNKSVWTSFSADAVLQGTGPAGSLDGIVATHGARVNVLSNVAAAGNTSVFGATGDILVVAGAAVAIDYGVGAGDFEEVAGFDGAFQRFPLVPGDRGDEATITIY